MFGSTDYRGDKAKMTTRISAAQESAVSAAATKDRQSTAFRSRPSR
jgi:hypothetical protein